MHLEDHIHQFVIFIKSNNKNFLDSILQQFNFGKTTEATATEESEEPATKNDREKELGEEDQPAPKKVEGAKSETDSSLGEEEEEEEGPKEERKEVSQLVLPK